MKKTVLAIDIGNTTVSLGLFRGRSLLRRFKRPTPRRTTVSMPAVPCDDVIIASVVPAAQRAIAAFYSQRKAIKPLIVGDNVRVPIKNRYRIPAQAGPDRLVNAYAGLELYGAPAIIVDYGTAVTFDAVSRRKEYIGGLILPGMQICLDALHEKTALLPRLALEKPRALIGRSTKESMTSGITYGFAALTESLIAMIKKEIGRDARVIATGGNARFMSAYCKAFDTVDCDLTLKGLQLIHEHYASE